MKTKEFIRRVEALSSDGVDVTGETSTILVSVWINDGLLAKVEKHFRYDLTTFNGDFYELSPSTQAELFRLLTEYAATPVEEREE